MEVLTVFAYLLLCCSRMTIKYPERYRSIPGGDDVEKRDASVGGRRTAAVTAATSAAMIRK